MRRRAHQGRTAVKPPTPVDAQRASARHGWEEGGAESEASGPKAGTLGKCDGQRTKEQRGARTPAHAKVGGAMVLAGQACCRFSRFIRPIPLIRLSWVRCPSQRKHKAGGVLRCKQRCQLRGAWAAARAGLEARVNREQRGRGTNRDPGLDGKREQKRRPPRVGSESGSMMQQGEKTGRAWRVGEPADAPGGSEREQRSERPPT